VLHLTRVTAAFAAVANVWFVILWTRAIGPSLEPGTSALHTGPLWLLLGAGTLVALGLFAFGACLNDILDLRRDRALRPEKPLASGSISLDGAMVLVVCTLIAAVLGATVFGNGAVWLTLVLAGAILALNAAGKFIPGIGLVLLGLVYAGHMLIPNVHLRFVWPAWLVMTHALAVGWAVHIVGRKVPRLSRRATIAALLGWIGWSAALLSIGWHRGREPGTWAAGLWPAWVDPWTAVAPAVLAVVFALSAWRKVRRYGPSQRAADKIARYGSLWPGTYACAWLLGTGHTNAGLVLAGVVAAGFLGMTLLRELYGIVEQPFGYRR
jgi:4-hydroxybenzoate polyprenyltransferase